MLQSLCLGECILALHLSLKHALYDCFVVVSSKFPISKFLFVIDMTLLLGKDLVLLDGKDRNRHFP